MRRFRVRTLNEIAAVGLGRLPPERYEIAAELSEPDAILVRSADLHRLALPASVKAVARAGAGTNNIPVEALALQGVPVFNAPGANANAVKELVLAGLLLAARNLPAALAWTAGLGGDDAVLHAAVEQGKKDFVGVELPGRTLGVVGLGAIGVKVANAARALGMRVIGFDPEITVQRAWQLDSAVEQALSLDELFARSEFVTVHVPLVDATRGIVNAQRLKFAKPGLALLNFAREAVVDEDAVHAALEAGRLGRYVTDFPRARFRGHPRAIALPHLGASTREAEENCAIMAADSLRDYLEHGTIRNSVNYPDVQLPRLEGTRLGIANRNVPNMVGQITTLLAQAGLNIVDLINKSRADVAYTLLDVEGPVPDDTLRRIAAVDGVLAARVI